MFKAILKSFVANIFFLNFFYKYCIKYFLILTVSFTKKKGHITGHVGLKPKTIQCYNPSNIFAKVC